MKKIFYVLLLFLIILLWVYIFKTMNHIYITAKFPELRPIRQKLDVYYKGLVVGRAHESLHSSDYQHTNMKITLFSKKMLLPINSEVHLKKERKRDSEIDFLEIIYPKDPSSVMIANGATLNGISTVDLDTFYANQHPDDIETIKNNLVESSQNLNDALSALATVFTMLNDILSENQDNLHSTTTDLSRAMGNLNAMSNKLNQAIKKERLNSTFENLEAATSNVKIISSDFTLSTKNTNVTLNNTQEITKNLNSITCGIKETLKKPLGGLRLFFGKVISSCKCSD